MKEGHGASNWVLLLVLVVAILAAAAIVGVGLFAVEQRGDDLCNLGRDNRMIIRRVLTIFEDSRVAGDPRFEEAFRILEERPANC